MATVKRTFEIEWDPWLDFLSCLSAGVVGGLLSVLFAVLLYYFVCRLAGWTPQTKRYSASVSAAGWR